MSIRVRLPGLLVLCLTVAATALPSAAHAVPAIAASADASPDVASVVPADGVTTTALPVSSFGQVLASPVPGGHVFVRPEEYDPNGVVALTQAGTAPEDVAGTAGAVGMALTPDGDTLFVTVPRQHEIVSVDTRTLATTSYDLGDDVSPATATVAAGRLWFCSRDTQTGCYLMSWTPEGGVVATDFVNPYFSQLSTDSTAQADVLLVQTFNDFAEVAVDATGATTAVAHSDLVNDGFPGPAFIGPFTPAVAAPDGRTFFAGGYGGSQVFTTAGIQRTDWLPSPPGGDLATAVAADGSVAIGSMTQLGTTGTDLYVYAPGATRYARSYHLSLGSSSWIEGLAYGGSTLYAVTAGADNQHFALDVVPDPLDDGQAPPDAGPGTDVPLDHFHQVLADPATGRVFVDGGVFDNGVVVTDASGRHARLLQHLPGPGDMTLSPDGRWLFVPLARADAVARIDTRTLAVRRFPLGSGSAPISVIDTGDRLLVLAGLADAARRLVVASPTSGRILTADSRLDCTRLAVDPLHASRWYALGCQGPVSPVVSFTLAGRGTATRVRIGSVAPSDSPSEGLATTPDGQHLLATGGSGTDVEGSADFGAQGALGTRLQSGATALAVRSDGLVATWADGSRPGVSPLVLWRGVSGPFVGTRLPQRASDRVAPRGLTFGARDLYAILSHATSQGASTRLVTVSMPALRAVSLDTDRLDYQPGGLARVLVHTETGRRGQVCLYRVVAGARHRLACRSLASGDTHTVRTRVTKGEHLVATVREGRRTTSTTLPLVVTSHPATLDVEQHGTRIVRAAPTS